MSESARSRAQQAAAYRLACTADDIDPPDARYAGPDLPTDWETILNAAEWVVNDGEASNAVLRSDAPVLLHYEAFVSLRRALGR
jgi:hypothetical protein